MQLFPFPWCAQKNKLVIGQHGLFHLWPLKLNLNAFNSHLYVVGASGQGKSKFLQSVLYQLTTNSTWGCGVFDPHADLAKDILMQLAAYPRERPFLREPANLKRIIYIDPARDDYLPPLNILRNSFASPYETAENVVEAFRRVWPETLSEAPRFAQILRNALLALIYADLTVLELEPLLTNKTFREQILTRCQDAQVASFFHQQFDQWGRDQAIFVSPVLNKITAFLFRPQVRYMLGAQENSLDLRKVIDERKILIVNLGSLHADEPKRLLGSLLLTTLENAAHSRENILPEHRNPFFCLIDEFSLFCAKDATTLAQILSESRKYRLHLGLAHQTISQLSSERMQGALENAKLKVIFGTGRQTAEALVTDLYVPNAQKVKHIVEDANQQEKSHPLYYSMMEQIEQFTQKIQHLAPQRAIIKLPENPKKEKGLFRFPKKATHVVRTPQIPRNTVPEAHLAKLVTYLVCQAGRPVKELMTQITKRHAQYGIGGVAWKEEPTGSVFSAQASTGSQVNTELFWQKVTSDEHRPTVL